MKKQLAFLALFILIAVIAGAFPDSDKDSIPDEQDRCNNSLTTLVDRIGCSCSQKTDVECITLYPEAVCCKENEACVRIDFKIRCALDSDKDGIPDMIDNCPNSTNNRQEDADNDSIGDECDKGEEIEKLSPPPAQEEKFIEDWSYDKKEDIITINYANAEHEAEINFDEPANPEDVEIVETTSQILDQEWGNENKRLTIGLDGEKDTQGTTKIKSPLEPSLVKIDDTLLSSPRSGFPYWMVTVLVVIVVALGGLLINQRRKSGLQELLELKTYVMDALNRGYTPEQLRNSLITDGWDKKLVEKAFKTVQQPKKATPLQLIEMQNYITANLRRGYTKQQIRAILIRDGWPPNEVDEAFRNIM